MVSLPANLANAHSWQPLDVSAIKSPTTVAHSSWAGRHNASLSPSRSYLYGCGHSSYILSTYWFVDPSFFLASRRITCRAFSNDISTSTTAEKFSLNYWAIQDVIYCLPTIVGIARLLFSG